MARGRKRGLIDLHVPSSPPTDTCIPQNNHSTSNTISFLAVSDLLRLFPAVSGHILTFSRALEQSDAGVTAEYGPVRAQKNQTGKWYPQIPVDHTTLQINQRVVNTTLIPVKLEHWLACLLACSIRPTEERCVYNPWRSAHRESTPRVARGCLCCCCAALYAEYVLLYENTGGMTACYSKTRFLPLFAVWDRVSGVWICPGSGV